MDHETETNIFQAIHILSGGTASNECRARVIWSLRQLLKEIEETNAKCEICGGTCVIEPESGDDSLDREYPCSHKINLELTHNIPNDMTGS